MMNTNVCDGEIEKERQDRLVELAARWRLGDKSAAEQLTRELYPMLKACAMRAGRHRVDDEALSEATFAMLNAARRYDPARKVPFTRYVWRIATGALVTSCRMFSVKQISPFSSSEFPIVIVGKSPLSAGLVRKHVPLLHPAA